MSEPKPSKYAAKVAARRAAAVAKPRRNCDVGTPEEQTDRMHEEYCSCHDCFAMDPPLACPLCKPGVDCRLLWAQMPYKKKETKSWKHPKKGVSRGD